MAIYFSEKFKQYRKAKDLTQEQLADIFHVSPQAISRWETGATCPDIELLPSIAAYFEVTVDELLGVDKIKDKARIDEITAEIYEKWTAGDIKAVIEMSRSAMREFPHEYMFQKNLAHALDMNYDSNEDKRKEQLHEAMTILERILDNCTDNEVRDSTLFTLSHVYKRIGNKEKAIETAKKLSHSINSSCVVLPTLLEGDELHELLKKNISNFAGKSAWYLHEYANSMYSFGSHENIVLINKAIEILNVIYEDGDYGYYNHSLQRYHFDLAQSYYMSNDFDNALTCIEKAAQHAIDYDNPSNSKHTSLAVRDFEKVGMVLKNIRTNQSHDMLHGRLPHFNFDKIKDDERFKVVIAKLEQHAKSE